MKCKSVMVFSNVKKQKYDDKESSIAFFHDMQRERPVVQQFTIDEQMYSVMQKLPEFARLEIEFEMINYVRDGKNGVSFKLLNYKEVKAA